MGPLVLFSLLAVAGSGGPAESSWSAVAAPGGVANLARSAGLAPDLPRWRALFEITRRLHPTYGEMSGAGRALKDVASFLDSVGQVPGAPAGDAAPARRLPRSVPSPDAVPLPLGPEVWRRALFRQATSDEAVVSALLRSRPASLLYRGLVQLDEETLAFLAQHSDVLSDLARLDLDAFSVFAGSWRVRQGRVAVPGGDEAAPLWETAVGEKTSRPGRFLQKLVTRDSGRLFFFYDSVDRLDSARQRFALGLGTRPGRPDDVFRVVREVFSREPTWWKPGWGSFSRTEVDAGRVLQEVRVLPSGELAPPAGRVFWRAVFGAGSGPERETASMDAAFLVQHVASGTVESRRLRLEQIRFAQRVFGEAPPASVGDMVTAVQGLDNRPALVYALERMGFRDPVLYTEALRASRRFDRLSGDAQARALAQFQGALLILDRARFRRTLDPVAAESLLRWLLAVPLSEQGEFEGRIAAWLSDAALPVLAEAVYGPEAPGSAEVIVGRAIAGAVLPREAEPPPFEWEGLFYQADPGLAELVRFERVRERAGGNSLEPVLAFCRAAGGTQPLAARLSELREVARALGPPAFPDSEESPPPREVVEEAAREARRNGEERANARLVREGDALLADALLAIAYAPHVGDDPGEALPGGSVARRHVFGAAAWRLASEKVVPGQRWHVEGALPGLDLGLARLLLRRLSPEVPSRPPGIDARARLAFAQGAALLNPLDLDDGGRDAVAAAIRRGRARVRQLRDDAPTLAAVAREAGLGAFRTGALRFVVVNEPSALPEFFSLAELFRLGIPERAGGDVWGAPALAEGGGWRLRMPPPRPMDDLAGLRIDELLAARMPDLALRAAADLSARRLPASLAPALLTYVITDFAEEVEPIGNDDWLALSRYLLDMKPARVDDYVAALTGDGPLRPAADPEAAP